MSEQTKEQAIGYILKACIESELPSNRLLDVAKVSNRIIENGANMDNYETMRAIEIVADQLELSEELRKQLTSKLYYVFDMKTVDEAGDIFTGFTILFPFLERR